MTFIPRLHRLRKVLAAIETEPNADDIEVLAQMSDGEFQQTRNRHLARRAARSKTDSIGAMLLLSLVGVPYCLVRSVANWDPVWAGASLFWSVTGGSSYWYLAHIGRYWREHHAIRAEELRRFGASTFG